MRKIFQLALLITSSLLLIKCSTEDVSNPTNEGPLFVNGVTFQIGTNSTGNTYNSTIYQQTTVYKSRSFTILRGNSTTPENSESISVTINYPTSQSSINGTYELTVDPMDAMPNNTSHSSCAISTFSNEYGGDYTVSSGTVTVIDNGSDNYKLTFNNVVLKNPSSLTDTKTITGYCNTTFM